MRSTERCRRPREHRLDARRRTSAGRWPAIRCPFWRAERQTLAGCRRPIRGFPQGLERQTLAGCRRSIQCLSPSLERQTRARGQALDRPLAQRRLSGFSPGPENPHGACSLPGAATITDGSTPMRRCGGRDSCRTRRWIRWALRAPCKFSGSAENLLRCRLLQATDPGPSPERVSAFPSSGEGPGSVACPSASLPFQARGMARDRPPRPHSPSQANLLPPPRPPPQEQRAAEQHHVHQQPVHPPAAP